MIKRIRYRLSNIIKKYLTPNAYKNSRLIQSINNKFQGFKGLTDRVPRPSILKIRELYGSEGLRGAEIGVDVGVNADSILRELNMKKLYLIDSWMTPNGEKKYNVLLHRFSESVNVEIIREASEEAVVFIEDESLDFVYIDGNHDYSYIDQDINLWYKKIKRRGVVGGHDIFLCFGILEALRDFCFKKRVKFTIDFPDWYFIKNEGN